MVQDSAGWIQSLYRWTDSGGPGGGTAAVEAPPAGGGLLAAAAEAGVPARTVGETGGDRLIIASGPGRSWIDVEVSRLQAIWERAIPRRLETS